MAAPLSNLRLTELPLARETFTVRYRVTAEQLRDMPMLAHSLQMSSWWEETSEHLVVQLAGDVARAEGQRRPGPTARVLHWPATWRDHRRLALQQWMTRHPRWACSRLLAWWIQRHPVRYHEERVVTEIIEYRLCPHVTEKWDDRKDVHLYWLMERNPEASHA